MQHKIAFVTIVATSLFLSTSSAFAAESFEVSGWVPYWRSVAGSESITPQLGSFTEVNPFTYIVQQDGSLDTSSPLTDPEWVALRAAVKLAGARFIPTVMWSDPDAIDAVLSDPVKRTEHVRAITREVFAYDLDGIDIDYEGKYARTQAAYSLFMKELYESIGYNKWVMCTIEARTPLNSRYSTPEAIPADIEYANDYKEVNKYCDRMRIMAYDQGRVDVKLNDANTDPYIPIADPKWVEKVVNLAAQDISKDKIVIGVPTYGYEYDMFAATDGSGEFDYAKLWAFNPGYATDLAGKVGQLPARNAALELSFSFPAALSPELSKPLPEAVRVVTWSDAEAIKQKAELAKALGLRGIAIFKIDGGQDPALWNTLVTYKSSAPKSPTKTPNLELAKEEVAGGGVTPNPSPSPSPAPTPTPGTSTIAVPTRNLSPGSTGEDVRNLQKLLNKHGFTVASGVDSTGSSRAGSPGKETTTFGNATYRALVKFQQSKKISPAVGHFGPKTRAVMQAL